VTQVRHSCWAATGFQALQCTCTPGATRARHSPLLGGRPRWAALFTRGVRPLLVVVQEGAGGAPCLSPAYRGRWQAGRVVLHPTPKRCGHQLCLQWGSSCAVNGAASAVPNHVPACSCCCSSTGGSRRGQARAGNAQGDGGGGRSCTCEPYRSHQRTHVLTTWLAVGAARCMLPPWAVGLGGCGRGATPPAACCVHTCCSAGLCCLWGAVVAPSWYVWQGMCVYCTYVAVVTSVWYGALLAMCWQPWQPQQRREHGPAAGKGAQPTVQLVSCRQAAA
jgi:hypothetical protein